MFEQGSPATREAAVLASRDAATPGPTRSSAGSGAASDATRSRPEKERRSPAPRVSMILGASALVLIAWSMTVVASSFGPESTAPRIIDFHISYIVGSLTLQGHLADAYAWATLQPLEAAFGRGIFPAVPFSYPPPVALLLAAVAWLPMGLAYTAFVVAGFALLVGALWRLDRTWFWPLVLTLSPAIFTNVAIGQYGMLAGGVAGLSALFLVEGRGRLAGVAAGVLATLKPQLCSTLPLLFLLRRRWRATTIALGTVAILFAVATLLLGPGILTVFLSALAESSRALSDGRIVLHRVTSVYGALRSFGVDSMIAMAIHLAVAALVLGWTAATAARIADRRTETGLALMATAFVSPYFHDYDLTIVGIGLALVLPAMTDRTISRHVAIALVTLALAESTGPFEALALTTRLSIGAPLVLACMASTLLGVNAMTGRRLRDDALRPRDGVAAI